MLAGLVVLSIAAGACSSDDSSDGGAAATATVAATASSTTTTAAPKQGGSITVAQFSALTGFDPALSQGFGTGGGIEQTALYDTLVRWNAQTQKYEPGTAQSFEPNADFTVWTLKLRSGITFSDGTAYDAAAVKTNMERHLPASARSGAAPMMRVFLDSVTVADPLTVAVKLKQSWSGFPFLLTKDLGMIASPAAIQKAGANFNTAPGAAGAGPFVLDSFNPGESAVMKRNPNYFGGTVYLDQITFVLVQRGDATATYDAIKTGTAQAAYVRSPSVLASARNDKQSIVTLGKTPAGATAMMNSGILRCQGGNPANLCAGKSDGTEVTGTTATANPLVRQAVAAAIDPQVINQRVYQGAGSMNSAPFPADLPSSPGVAGPSYNADRAKQLVTQAKAGGWDGKIRVLAGTDPTSTAWGQAVTTMLTAAGMQVDYQNSKDTSGVVSQVLVQRDFDIVTWSIGLSDNSDNNFIQLYVSFSKFSPRYGYYNTDMDAGIDALRTAASNDQRSAAYKKIADAWVRDLPALPLATIEEAWVTNPKLRGVVAASAYNVRLDKAYLAD